MHQGDGGVHPLVREIRVVGFHLLGREHALVDDGATGQARQVEGVSLLLVTVANLVGSTLADDVQLALKGHLIGDGVGSGDEHLTHDGLV